MATKLSIDEQLSILLRGTQFADEVNWDTAPTEKTLREQMTEELREILKEGKQLRIYLGVDPTSPNLHVGHFVPLQKLRQFQELGHQVIFLIGDYTDMIGDPTGQDKTRRRFTHEEVLGLAKTYCEQAFKVLDEEKTEVRYNGEWLAKLQFADIVELASIFPLRQIISRRDFKDRLDRGESLRFHESLYALMQGYDAHALECDVQVGAYDQHFNLLAGREIQKHFGARPHVMITVPLIDGTDGRKMSKSYGNTIDIRSTPEDMFGKTMRVSDEQLPAYVELTSGWPMDEIDKILAELKSGGNPMEIKKRLAGRLVEMYHGAAAAKEAEEHFRRVVQEKAAPDEIQIVKVTDDLMRNGPTWIDALAALNLTKSKGEARRLIQQGGFYVEQETVGDVAALFDPEMVKAKGGDGLMIRLGKRRYYRLIPS
ncbi:MAG: tyrosine--tRNA ligase [Candidatus Eisenbacteria bacterium]|nr:tyrosine--tRNA ligase [Candidatus Eisenbacteria bacterium]